MITPDTITAFPVIPTTLEQSHIDNRVFFIGDSFVSTHYFSGSGLNTGFQTVRILNNLFATKNINTYERDMEDQSKFIAKRVRDVSVIL